MDIYRKNVFCRFQWYFHSSLNDLVCVNQTFAGPVVDVSSEDTIVFMTKGTGEPGILSSNEIYPLYIGCSLPPSYGSWYAHALLTTQEPKPRIASCGGRDRGFYTASCLVFNQETQAWEKNIMSDLAQVRAYQPVVTLNNIGTYMIGGSGSVESHTTADFLEKGSLNWVGGPQLPMRMQYVCAVQIGPKSFLAMTGNDIREYLVNMDNPVSDDGWQDVSKWPQLRTWRFYFGCTVINKKVVITGGRGRSGETIQSTEVLDLVTRRIEYAGDLNKPRHAFHTLTILSGGIERVLALGGCERQPSEICHDSVEELNEKSLIWSPAPDLLQKRADYGAIAVPKSFICQT